MKVSSTKVKKVFKPFEITITFESPEEVGGFYAAFNHVDILRAIELKEKSYRKIKDTMNNSCNIEIPYYKYHSNLCKALK